MYMYYFAVYIVTVTLHDELSIHHSINTKKMTMVSPNFNIIFTINYRVVKNLAPNVVRFHSYGVMNFANSKVPDNTFDQCYRVEDATFATLLYAFDNYHIVVCL